jgi:hypothetical protein
MLKEFTKAQIATGSRTFDLKAGTKPRLDGYVTPSVKLVSDLLSGKAYRVNQNKQNITVSWFGSLAGVTTPPDLTTLLQLESLKPKPDFDNVVDGYLRSPLLSAVNVSGLKTYVNLQSIREMLSNGSFTMSGILQATGATPELAMRDGYVHNHGPKGANVSFSEGWEDDVDNTSAISMSIIEGTRNPEGGLWVRNGFEHGNDHYRTFYSDEDMAWYLMSRIKRGWDALFNMQAIGNEQRIWPSAGQCGHNNAILSRAGKFITLSQLNMLCAVWPQDWYNPAIKYTREQFYALLEVPGIMFYDFSVPGVMAFVPVPMNLGKIYEVWCVDGLDDGIGWPEGGTPAPVKLIAWPFGPRIDELDVQLLTDTAFAVDWGEPIPKEMVGCIAIPPESTLNVPADVDAMKNIALISTAMSSLNKRRFHMVPNHEVTVGSTEDLLAEDLVESLSRAILMSYYYDKVSTTPDGFVFSEERDNPVPIYQEDVGLANLTAYHIVKYLDEVEGVDTPLQAWQEFLTDTTTIRLYGNGIGRLAQALRKWDEIRVTAESLDSEYGTAFSAPALNAAVGASNISIFNCGLPVSSDLSQTDVNAFILRQISDLRTLSAASQVFAVRTPLPCRQLANIISLAFDGNRDIDTLIVPCGWDGAPIFISGHGDGTNDFEPGRYAEAAFGIITATSEFVAAFNDMRGYAGDDGVGGWVGYTSDEAHMHGMASALLAASSEVTIAKTGDRYLGVGLMDRFRTALFNYIHPGKIDMSSFVPFESTDAQLSAPGLGLATACSYGFMVEVARQLRGTGIDRIIDIGGRNFRGAHVAWEAGATEYIVIDPVPLVMDFDVRQGYNFEYIAQKFQDVNTMYQGTGAIVASFMIQNSEDQTAVLRELVTWRDTHAPGYPIFANAYGECDENDLLYLRGKVLVYEADADGRGKSTFLGYEPVRVVTNAELTAVGAAYIPFPVANLIAGAVMSGSSPMNSCVLGAGLSNFLRTFVIR